jgi:sialidase-1
VDPAPFLDGNWHHAAVTYNGQIVTMYMDGIARASSTWSYDTTPHYITIGTEIAGDGTPFKGLIDDVVFFARALSAQEIAALATH